MNTIHDDLPFEDYCAEEGINASMIKLAHSKTLKHVYAAFLDPAREVDNSDFKEANKGKAVHSLTLEGQVEEIKGDQLIASPEFYDQFAVGPKCDRRTKVGKELWNDFAEANKGKSIVKAEDFAIIEGCTKALHTNEYFQNLLKEGYTEQSIFWEDEKGRKCKMRADLINMPFGEVGTVWDVKTTADISREGFSRDCARYGYHIQAAHYLDGVNAIYPNSNITQFGFIVVEKKYPFDVAIRIATPEFIDRGREIVKEQKDSLWLAMQGGVWEGYDQFEDTVHLPPWA